MTPLLTRSAVDAAEPGPAATAAAPGAPVQQVAPAVVAVVRRADGSGQINLSLHPGDLGHVRIEVGRTADGSVNVVVTASEPGTLRSLQGDQAHLHAALDAAAHAGADRHVSFVLDPGIGAAPQERDGGGGGTGRSGTDAGTGNREARDDRGNRPDPASGRWIAGSDDAGWADGETVAPSREPRRMLINVLA